MHYSMFVLTERRDPGGDWEYFNDSIFPSKKGSKWHWKKNSVWNHLRAGRLLKAFSYWISYRSGNALAPFQTANDWCQRALGGSPAKPGFYGSIGKSIYGLPSDRSDDLRYGLDMLVPHSEDCFFKCTTLKELVEFDYNQKFVYVDENEKTKRTNYRKFLGKEFFESVEALKQLGAPEDVRVICGFLD